MVQRIKQFNRLFFEFVFYHILRVFHSSFIKSRRLFKRYFLRKSLVFTRASSYGKIFLERPMSLLLHQNSKLSFWIACHLVVISTTVLNSEVYSFIVLNIRFLISLPLMIVSAHAPLNDVCSRIEMGTSHATLPR